MSVRIIENHTNRKTAVISHDGNQYEVTRRYYSNGPYFNSYFCKRYTEARLIADIFVNSPE